MVQSKKFRGVRQRHWGSWVSEIRHPLLYVLALFYSVCSFIKLKNTQLDTYYVAEFFSIFVYNVIVQIWHKIRLRLFLHVKILDGLIQCYSSNMT